jgi:zinc transport system substrate-binding protein
MIKKVNNIILALILSVVFLSGCISQDEPSSASPSGNISGNASDRIKVAATITPLGDFVRSVGGEKVDVTVIVPPGAEPHTFEPTPSQMKDVAKADLYVMNGAGLEFWMDKVMAINKNMIVVDSSIGVNLIQESEGEMDPHIWISLRNAAVQVNNICSGLIDADPANRDYYARNRDDYLQKLQALDNKLNLSFAASKKNIFIVHHPAWTYFARDYGLMQLPLMENEKEPGPKYLGHVIDLARNNNITTIFVEPEYNPKAAEVIAREMSASVVSLDPLAENYLQNMAYAGREIAGSLA